MPDALHFVAVHGAFRGAWYWEPLSKVLAERGHTLHAVDLPGMGHPEPPRRPDITMNEWVDQVLELMRTVGGSADGPVVLLGHSMGGVVVQAALATLSRDSVTPTGATPGPPVEVVLLDSPVVGPGQSAVDVSSAEAPTQLPPREAWIEPTALAAGGEIDDELLSWVNERLCATPVGPQLDPLPEDVRGVGDRCHLVFFEDTPDAFPAPISRLRCEALGVPFTLGPGGHDQPLANPGGVADLILGLVDPVA